MSEAIGVASSELAADGEVTLSDVWEGAVETIHKLDPAVENWKKQILPLAKVKKIMKQEEVIMQELERERLQKNHPGAELDKKQIRLMVSAEAPVVMVKACEMLVVEITARAWQHTSRSRRRTVQKIDLHSAIGESELFDFLIDVVPRVVSTRENPTEMPTPQQPQQPFLYNPMSLGLASDATMTSQTTAAAMGQLSSFPTMPQTMPPQSLQESQQPVQQFGNVFQPMGNMELQAIQQQDQPEDDHDPDIEQQHLQWGIDGNL